MLYGLYMRVSNHIEMNGPPYCILGACSTHTGFTLMTFCLLINSKAAEQDLQVDWKDYEDASTKSSHEKELCIRWSMETAEEL